jgi:hypothetical protein
MQKQFVTFNFNASTMVNTPSLTTNPNLASSYESWEAADISRDQLKSREFGKGFQIEEYKPGRFQLVAGNEREFVVLPVKLLDAQRRPVYSYDHPDGVEFEQCAPDDHYLIAWSLYERLEDGRLEWQKDFRVEVLGETSEARAKAQVALEEAQALTLENPDLRISEIVKPRQGGLKQ